MNTSDTENKEVVTEDLTEVQDNATSNQSNNNSTDDMEITNKALREVIEEQKKMNCELLEQVKELKKTNAKLIAVTDVSEKKISIEQSLNDMFNKYK